MAISVLSPTATSTVNAQSYTVPTANKQYKATQSYDAAVYTVTVSPTSSTAKVYFYTSSGVTITTTVSGTVTVNLANSATEVYIQSSVDSDVVTITKTASALSGTEISGTLDTITSTGTYNQTGKLFVVCVGGGSGGNGGQNGSQGQGAGAGGNAGAISGSLVFTNTATSVTVGSAGNGGAGGSFTGNAGGTTSFGNLVSAGITNTNGGYITNSPIASTQVTNPNISVKSGTNGGGGHGGTGLGPFSPGNGAGSGIGTGGNGGASGTSGTAGNAATGYGAGGGGGGGGANSSGGAGGAGSPGVIYVLRGF